MTFELRREKKLFTQLSMFCIIHVNLLITLLSIKLFLKEIFLKKILEQNLIFMSHEHRFFHY